MSFFIYLVIKRENMKRVIIKLSGEGLANDSKRLAIATISPSWILNEMLVEIKQLIYF